VSDKSRATLLTFFLLGLIVILSLYGLAGVNYKLPDSVVSPAGLVAQSMHANGQDEAWILGVKDKNVQARLVDSKAVIIFHPTTIDLSYFQGRTGWIAPVTFICGNATNKDCDLKKPFKLYVSNREVRFIELVKAPK